MSARQVIKEFRRNSRENVVIALDQFQDHDVIDIRSWYLGAGDEWKPGRQGLSLSVKHLPNLAEGLAAALSEATRRGLIDSEADSLRQ